MAYLCLNFAQAFITPLASDEAYYWTYSKFIDWGYFDHPPMIALFILASSFISGELGVRLLIIVAQVLSLVLTYKYLIDNEKKQQYIPLLFTIAFSLPILHIYGFVATPDTPLLFFSVIYLIAYKTFLEKHTHLNTLLLGISMAAMMYSKYHGILLIFFTLLSNLSLLKRPAYYVAAFIGVIAFLPHLIWQYFNGFPSFKYHLVERAEAYKPFYSFEFLLNILVSYHPFLIVVLLISLFKIKPNNLFIRALYFTIFGFLIFFLFSSIRGHVQPQWTIIIVIPTLIILFNKLIDSKIQQKILYYSLIVYVPIILIARAEFVSHFLPLAKPVFTKGQNYVNEINRIAQGRKVLFLNSYQNVASYWFYSAEDTVAMVRDYRYRRSQFDVWNFQESYRNKNVLVIGGSNKTFDSAIIEKKMIYFAKIDSFIPLHALKIHIINSNKILYNNKLNYLNIEIYNPNTYSVALSPKRGTYVRGVMSKRGEKNSYFNLKNTLDTLINAQSKIITKVEFEIAWQSGEYNIGFAPAQNFFVYPNDSLVIFRVENAEK